MTKESEAEVAAELVSRIIGGDKKAESEMVERYQRGLLFMLQHRANNDALAADIAQETWRIVIEKVRAGLVKQPAKLAAFIVQIGKNQLLMSYRGSHHTKVTTDVDIQEVADGSDAPYKAVERHNITLVVRQLVGELKNKRDREVLMRFYVNEENKDIICEEFELSELHFNRVLFRARQRFKQLWTENFGTEKLIT